MKTFKIDVTRIVEHIDHITIDVSANSLAEAKEAVITELDEGSFDFQWEMDDFPSVRYELEEAEDFDN